MQDVFPVLMESHKSLPWKSRGSLTGPFTTRLQLLWVKAFWVTQDVLSFLVTLVDGTIVLWCADSFVVLGFRSRVLKQYGMDDDMKYILMAWFDASDEEVQCLGGPIVQSWF